MPYGADRSLGPTGVLTRTLLRQGVDAADLILAMLEDLWVGSKMDRKDAAEHTARRRLWHCAETQPD